jgi:hypothetical protein
MPGDVAIVTTGITVYTGQKKLYGRDKKISGMKRVPVCKSLLTYKLSLLRFTEFSGITRVMYGSGISRSGISSYTYSFLAHPGTPISNQFNPLH